MNKPEPIELQKHVIEGTQPGPHLLLTGGVHGDEFEPMAALRRLIGIVQREDLRGRLTLVPVVNEAAFRRCHRTADDGLDLARTCPGRPDGSVTERTAHALSELIRSADYYIDLHTGGTTLAVFPMAGYMLHPDLFVLDRQRQMARAFNLPVIWGTDPTLEGRSMSVARDAGVPAIYVEYEGSAVCNPRGVAAYVEGCLNVMAMLGMIEQPGRIGFQPVDLGIGSSTGWKPIPRDRPQPPSRVEHVVEDARPGSGHMQRCNPSPATGYFEAAVTLGDRVQLGQTLGWVTDPLGHLRHTIVSSEQGLVLVLRTFPSVTQGDSLAVILGL